ncbi:SH3 domain-containing protein [Butyrivibrio sp. FCS006]|uniref:SH3 domain-containing protein n=1 Tax=Butyrivibrio sp. FCS006 TaxID=1280684 RepID=UPI0004235C46|nr:SH3 domain-containing protein [Butyrivibrio sp. FCS006]
MKASKPKKEKKKVSGGKTLKSILKKVNPEPKKGSDRLVDYMTRVLLFLFPLLIFEETAFLSISMKDMLFGILILIMSLWCILKLLFKGGASKLSLGRGMLFVFGTFVLVLILFAVQMSKFSGELGHTYLYIGFFLLPFCVSFIDQESRYYMHIFLASYTFVYLSIIRFVITGTPTLLGIEKLLGSPSKIIPSMLLCCAVSSFLYITEKVQRAQNVYLGYFVVGTVALFMYGDMAAFMLLFLYLMCLQFLGKPTAGFLKKNFILLFAFAFCASNTPLLTYFGIKGYTRQFDLEYSIYIDIVIAVAGLIITSYWDKVPKDKDGDQTLMTGLSAWFKRAIPVVLTLLAITFIFGSRGNSLKDTIGGKAIAGFSGGLWNAVNSSSGEIWHVLAVYGVIGAGIMLMLGLVVLGVLYKGWPNPGQGEVSRGYILIAVMFMAQSLFYPFSSESTPTYLIFLGFAIAASMTLVEEDAPEAKEESDLQVIWVPQRVKEAIRAEHRNNGKEEPSKAAALARAFAPQACELLAAVFAASLLIMVAFALYRVFMPVGNAGSEESLVQVAVTHRQEQLAAKAEAEAAENSLDLAADESVEEASAKEAQALVANAEASKEPLEEAAAEAKEEATKESEDAEAGEEEAEAQEPEADDEEAEAEEEEEPSEPEAGVSHGDYRIYDPKASYDSVEETVSGRGGMVNLRSIPSTGNGSRVIHALEEGETVRRIAIGQNGWSRVIYNGRTLYAVSEYLEVVPEGEEAEAEGDAAGEEEVAEGQEAPAEAPAEESKKEEKPKTPASYSVQWTDHNRSISIWSAGVLQGTMTVTDGEGNVKEMTGYGDYYQGSGKNQKRYFSIYVPQGESPLTINADGGFVEAIKGMGYSGLYFNKAIHNW